MTEVNPLKEEKLVIAPAPEAGPAPVAAPPPVAPPIVASDADSTPALTESNKKRVMLGSIIGGALFLGLIIAIIILVSTAGTHYKPNPKPTPPKKIINNPWKVEFWHMKTDHILQAVVKNHKREMENTTFVTKDAKLPGRIPDIKNTTENPEMGELVITWEQVDEHLLNYKVKEPEWERWEVPYWSRMPDPYELASKYIKDTPMSVQLNEEGKLFEWSFYGKRADPMPMFQTHDCRFQFFDKYIEFEARLQTDYIWGMGERVETFHLHNDNYSMWNRDHTYELGDDSEPGTYGSHPFFLNRLMDKKDFIGVYMHNSNAMLFSFWNVRNNGTFINYKFIGGIIDLYIIHSTEPVYILRKYHSIIGRPYLPPTWGMGFQQARQGYVLDEMKKVVQTYQTERIPIDAIWADEDINVNHKTFTVDDNTFKGIKDFVHWLHDPHEGIDMRFVVVANPGLKVEAGYKYYDEALAKRQLIMSALHFDQPYQGRTAADKTVWLDYFQHDAILIWAEGLHDLYELTSLDGVWIYENEPSNRCDGECKYRSDSDDDEYYIPNPFHNASEFDYIQFRPTLDPLERNTLPMAAYECCSDLFTKQFNTHQLFGLHTAEATHDSLAGIFEDKRFLVVSRASFPGSGHYSSHQLGNNYASWKSMIGSIAGMMNFNLFGIPHVGASIGGFYGNADSELLTRWYELGCFSPLMLSYSSSMSNRKEAYVNETTKAYIHNAMVERYMLLHYFYTRMFEAFAHGGPVIHPLFFDFPEDEECYKPNIADRTFMWGRQLYVIPVLISGMTRSKVYLPNWRWYDLRTGDMVRDYFEGSSGEYRIFEQPLGYITVLVKGGSIIPHQRMVGPGKIMNVEDLKKIPALLVIAPDHLQKAYGTLIVDSEGIRPHPDPMSHTYRHYAFTYYNQIFRINKLAGFDFHEEYEFDYFWELIILDVFGNHHVEYVCMMATDFKRHELQFFKSHESNALIIHDDRMAKMAMFNLESIVWGTVDQHDFCKFGVHVQSHESIENGKGFIAEIVTTEPSAYQLKFDLTAKMLTNHIINMMIKMNDPKYTNWIVPDVLMDDTRKCAGELPIAESGFRIAPKGQPFHFEYADPQDPHDFIITSKYLPFVYVRNFMHVKMIVNAKHMFGLGERVHSFELNDGIYSLWNADQNTEETGLPPGNNMYGSHPFYMIHGHDPHEFLGVLFLTSNPFDVRIKHTGMQMQVDHIFSGGIIDMFLIMEGFPAQVMQDYCYLIGHPLPLPFWAFGYHQSRWGYKDIEHVKEVVSKLEHDAVPFDAIWMDKDYMIKHRSFTIDNQRFYGLKEFVETQLHAKGRKFVTILDPAVAIDHNFDVYNRGMEQGVFLKSAFNNEPMVGVTWPGYSVWFDFIHPSTANLWMELLQELYEKVPFEGIVLDMNEPSNFCDGECPDGVHYIYYHFPLDFYDDLYYNPTHRPLEHQTISMETLHYGAEKNPEFNYHNMYGLYQSRETFRFFASHLRKRAMILSSSSFPGIGRTAGHWLGDNYSSWHHMEYSIAGIASFNIFGIPFVGADICGYLGNTTVNLCSRWYQLGAFYPMMRNHNSPGSKGQEPYSDPKILEVAKKSIHTRYSLLRYLYSEYMYSVHHAGMVFYPVLFEFPSDLNLYSIIDNTFMFGHALRITPVLADKVTELTSYFPNSDWYEFLTWKHVVVYNKSRHIGFNLTIPCALEANKLNIHVRGGSIFAWQDQALEGTVLTATQLHELPMKIIIAPDERFHAIGTLYYDKDEILDFRNREFHEYVLDLTNHSVSVKMEAGEKNWRYDRMDEKLAQILVLGGHHWPNSNSAKIIDVKGGEHSLKFERHTDVDYFILTPSDMIPIEDIKEIVWN